MPRRSSSKGNKATFDAAAAGRFLYRRRSQLGWSQRDLARRANVAQQTVANIEQAIGSGSIHKIEAVALALGLDLLTVIRKSIK